jgi:hypothetical protein
VNRVLQPSILYFESEEAPAGPEYPANFCERLVLLFTRAQMVQNKNGNRGRKTPVGEGQSRGVASQDRTVIVSLPRRKSRSECVVVFETRNARRAPPQLVRRRPRTRTDLQHVVAQLRTRQNPRQ